MTTTLAIDASTYVGSVAVLDGDRVLAERDAAMRGRDAEQLMPAVAETLSRSGKSLDAVDRIVCGAGPGSFTSLRIAASLSKGMALGASKPLHAVSSLALIVAGNADSGASRPARFIAVLDAMRGECFVAEFEVGAGGMSQVGPARLVARSDVSEVAERAGARPVGPDEPDAWLPRARGVAVLRAPLLDGPVDLTSWEPEYGRLAEAQARWEAAHGGTLPR